MKRTVINSIIIGAFLLLIGFNLYQHFNEKEKSTITTTDKTSTEELGTSIGQKAPDFSLTTMDGQPIKLSDLKGKKVILNFWATWCPPCKAEMPHMQSFYEKHKNENITILAVNLTSQDKGDEAISTFIQDYGLTFPIPLDRDGMVGSAYQIITIPTSFFIDEKGTIQQKVVGPMDEETMLQMINSK